MIGCGRLTWGFRGGSGDISLGDVRRNCLTNMAGVTLLSELSAEQWAHLLTALGTLAPKQVGKNKRREKPVQ